MSCRKPCRECPFANNNPFSLKFRGYVDKMKKLEKVKDNACHMITSDIWGFSSEINDKNVCIGSKTFSEKKI